ncbi:histone deacetylase family protein [Aquidulcibacter paucihalophilus]|uniref:histone deacetylase family protein n=1 Tax=Aquidulcibacter paucihalophilus TaxID=1978549 RepID=UPI000A18F4E3|nr:histone deacetylase [Aquidulcibacter paucihalophilus]
MRLLPIVHHPDYTADTPDGHRFPMQKFAQLAEILRAEGLAPHGFVSPEPILREDLIRAHTPAYVDAVLSRTLDSAAVRRIGFNLSERVVLRAQLATAGTLLAARLALQEGLACNSAGGSHHARADQGAGFCVFNDVAVAASVLLAEGAVKQILVVDLDVHHGDGTALIFRNEPRVFTFSLHCDDNWPLEKPPSDVDVALPKGMGDAGYLAALNEHLPALLDEVRPDVVFYIAGVDPHQDDRLGKLALTDQGLMTRDRRVIEAVRRRAIPLVTVLGGGYGHDVTAVARRHSFVFHAAADFLVG